MTPLRQRRIEDMQLRHLGSATQRACLHSITGVSADFYLQLTGINLRLCPRCRVGALIRLPLPSAWPPSPC